MHAYMYVCARACACVCVCVHVCVCVCACVRVCVVYVSSTSSLSALTQAHYQTVANSLSATQQQVEQLNRQMAHEQKQVCTPFMILGTSDILVVMYM